MNGKLRLPNYNTPVLTNGTTCPIIGLTGLLSLVAVVEKLQTTQIVEEEDAPCRPEQFPPAHTRQCRHPVVGDAARHESPTPRVAAQSPAGTPIGRTRRQKGGQP